MADQVTLLGYQGAQHPPMTYQTAIPVTSQVSTTQQKKTFNKTEKVALKIFEGGMVLGLFGGVGCSMAGGYLSSDFLIVGGIVVYSISFIGSILACIAECKMGDCC